MTYTYSLSTNIGKIRLEIADTNDGTGGQAKLTDEEIQYAIDNGGSTIGYWVIKALLLIRAKLNDPNFKADWLEVDLKTARESMDAFIADKRREYGISAVTATTGYAWRPDSNQTEAPTWDSTEEDE
jgi:hypothetical protein